MFPPPVHEATTAAYRRAYERAGQDDRFTARFYPRTGHYTSPEMRDDAVAWLTAPHPISPTPA